MSLTKPEKETIITWDEADRVARVWTAQRPVITRLKAVGAELVEEGKFEGTPWAEFTLPSRFIGFRTVR